MSHFGDCPVRAWGEEQMYAEDPDPEPVRPVYDPHGFIPQPECEFCAACGQLDGGRWHVRDELSALRFLLDMYGFTIEHYDEPGILVDGSRTPISLRVTRPETLAKVLARALERQARG